EHTSELQSRRDLVCRLLLEKNKDVCSRSEEHTSELQSRRDTVCRLLLEKNLAAIYFPDLTFTGLPVRADWSAAKMISCFFAARSRLVNVILFFLESASQKVSNFFP